MMDELPEDGFLMYQTEDQFLPVPYMPPLRTRSMEKCGIEGNQLTKQTSMYYYR